MSVTPGPGPNARTTKMADEDAYFPPQLNQHVGALGCPSVSSTGRKERLPLTLSTDLLIL